MTDRSMSALERAARAVAPKAWAALDRGDRDDQQEYRRKASLRHAAAAFRALREPDEAMVHAICPYINGRNNQDCNKCPRTYEEPNYGACQKMCFALAEEAIRMTFDSILAGEGR